MLRSAIHELDPPDGSLLFVENVGNLVCPALFDLGETAKVVVISVTEGADKPLKYPHMFAGADLLIVNKSDLLPYVDFDVSACVGYARQLNPQLPAIVLSATTGAGLDQWYEWLVTAASSPPAIGKGGLS
jgi:hydrogenase nickel incorporation protein HypB